MPPASQGRKVFDFALRNEITLAGLVGVLPKLRRFVEENDITDEIIELADIEIKYSPVGAALLRHKVGDVVRVVAPDGEYKLVIKAIS